MTPHHSVGLLVWMPNAMGHTQPVTSRTADARRVIDKLKYTQCSININKQQSRENNLEKPEEYVAVSREEGIMARSWLNAV